MLVVDSGVWIDFFNARPNPARDALRRVMAQGDIDIVVPDLVLFEVLRGFRHERDHRQARLLMHSLTVQPTGSAVLAEAAAGHYRALRAEGITVRSAIDVLIASFCIEQDYVLLHHDRDFDGFQARRGLKVWPHDRLLPAPL